MFLPEVQIGIFVQGLGYIKFFTKLNLKQANPLQNPCKLQECPVGTVQQNFSFVLFWFCLI